MRFIHPWAPRSCRTGPRPLRAPGRVTGPSPDLPTRSGAAAVEFAVVLPVLVLLLVGGADLGRCFYSTIAVANAARAGAQYASMTPYDVNNTSGWFTRINEAVTDEFSSSSQFNTTLLTVTTTLQTESDGSNRVSVQVSYPFRTLIKWGVLPSRFTITQSVAMRVVR